MARIRQKLHSRSGASILLAMVLLLVAAMVSAVIISASVTAANRVSDDHVHQQQLLAVNSAARLLKKALSEASYTCTTETGTISWMETKLDEENNPYEELEFEDYSNESFKWLPAGGEKSLGSTLLKTIYENRTTPSSICGSYYFTIHPPEGGVEIAKAIARLTVLEGSGGSYPFTGAVYLVDEDFPSTPNAEAYETIIENSKAAVGISGYLRKRIVSGTPYSFSEGIYTYKITKVEDEIWNFDTIELFTMGLEDE